MKSVLVLILLSLGVNAIGQVLDFNDIPIYLLEKFEDMGKNYPSILNSCEGQYLNLIFEKSRNDFDFTGKKVGFITGSSGRKTSSKAEYFKLEKERFIQNQPPNGGTLSIFDKSQKVESGGYDAAIVYWSKILIPKNKVIKRLKNWQKNNKPYQQLP